MGVWDWLMKGFVQTWENFTKWFGETWTALGEFFTGVWDSIGNFVQQVTDSMTSDIAVPFQAAWDWLVSTYDSAVEWVGKMWTWVSEAFTSAWKWLGEWFVTFGKAIESLWTGAGTVFTNISTAAGKVGQAIIDAFNKAWEEVKKFFQNVQGAVNKVFGNSVHDYVEADMQKATKAVGSFASDFKTHVTDGATSAQDTVSSTMKSSFGTMYKQVLRMTETDFMPKYVKLFRDMMVVVFDFMKKAFVSLLENTDRVLTAMSSDMTRVVAEAMMAAAKISAMQASAASSSATSDAVRERQEKARQLSGETGVLVSAIDNPAWYASYAALFNMRMDALERQMAASRVAGPAQGPRASSVVAGSLKRGGAFTPPATGG
jgi:phage-related protein